MERSLFVTALVLAILSSITAKLLCNGQTDSVNCLSTDRIALLDFKNGLNDPANTLSSWRGTSCCRWRGIECDNITGSVTAIRLHSPFVESFNLSGEIRPSLLQIASLKHLDLSSNAFEGIPVPEFFGFFKNLQYLNQSVQCWIQWQHPSNSWKLVQSAVS